MLRVPRLAVCVAAGFGSDFTRSMRRHAGTNTANVPEGKAPSAETPAAEAPSAAPSSSTDSPQTPVSPSGEKPVSAASESTSLEEVAVGTDEKYRRVVSREFDNTIVEKLSREALAADGREHRIEAEEWREDTSYCPILAKGKRNVYDYTDDIPSDVKPLYAHQVYQSREWIREQRDRAARPLWKRFLRFGVVLGASAAFCGAVEFTRIWLQQPQEVASMRVKILENTYGKVLELGAGHGMNIGAYPYPVHEIVMVDQSQQLLDKLHYRIPKTAYPKYKTAQDRAERLENFKDGEFDCVVDMFGLCHYRDPVLALRQLQRVVKPTGTILLLEHGRSPYFPVNWVLDYFADRHTSHTHGCKWNLPLKEYFKEARLIVRELEQVHYGTTYYVVAHPEILDEAAMQHVPQRDVMLVR